MSHNAGHSRHFPEDRFRVTSDTLYETTYIIEMPREGMNVDCLKIGCADELSCESAFVFKENKEILEYLKLPEEVVLNGPIQFSA